MTPAKDRPFGEGIWTHVVVTFSRLNSGTGRADFYINGKHQGFRKIPEPFTWDVEKAKFYLGLNFVGLMDELAIFNGALRAEEVKILYELEDGVEGFFGKNK
ncbi:MAG: LamG-like jellyroll fold domain-containing protein [Bacteroidia bacterium]